MFVSGFACFLLCFVSCLPDPPSQTHPSSLYHWFDIVKTKWRYQNLLLWYSFVQSHVFIGQLEEHSSKTNVFIVYGKFRTLCTTESWDVALMYCVIRQRLLFFLSFTIILIKHHSFVWYCVLDPAWIFMWHHFVVLPSKSVSEVTVTAFRIWHWSLLFKALCLLEIVLHALHWVASMVRKSFACSLVCSERKVQPVELWELSVPTLAIVFSFSDRIKNEDRFVFSECSTWKLKAEGLCMSHGVVPLIRNHNAYM